MKYVRYSGPPAITWDNDNSEWIVLEDYTTYWDRPNINYRRAVTVEAGFTTDLASIPRAFHSFIPKVGHHIQPSITHDWCYENKVPGMTRAEADLMFLDGMKSEGVWWLRRHTMYRAVRLFGGSLWG